MEGGSSQWGLLLPLRSTDWLPWVALPTLGAVVSGLDGPGLSFLPMLPLVVARGPSWPANLLRARPNSAGINSDWSKVDRIISPRASTAGKTTTSSARTRRRDHLRSRPVRCPHAPLQPRHLPSPSRCHHSTFMAKKASSNGWVGETHLVTCGVARSF